MTQTVHSTVLLSDAQVTSLLTMGLIAGEADAAGACEIEALVAQSTEEDWERAVLDLQAPVLLPSAGPLALDRLLDVSDEQRQRFADHGLLDLLTSKDAGAPVLEQLQRYGAFLAESTCRKRTRLVGVLLMTLAGGVLEIEHGTFAEQWDRSLSRRILHEFTVAQSLPVSFRKHCDAIQSRMPAGPGGGGNVLLRRGRGTDRGSFERPGGGHVTGAAGGLPSSG